MVVGIIMKKIQIVIVGICLLLIGCNDNEASAGLSYDPSKIQKQLKEEQKIDSKLPTAFPVEIKDYEISPQTHTESSVHDVQFTGTNEEKFILMIHTKEVTYDGKPQGYEELKINNQEVFYIEDDLASSVHWKDGDYHYIFEYQVAESGKDAAKLTKEEMVEVAESFK